MKTLNRTSPESVGISSSALLRLMKRLDSLDSMNSIMLMRHGKVCLEGWWKPYEQETPHMLFSLSKSFTSVAIGIAAEEKRLGISDRVVDFFPEYKRNVVDVRMSEVTLRHLLTMTTGHAECAKPEMERDSKGDFVRGFLSSQLTFAPGEYFAYNSAATYMLSAIIKKTTGLTVREYLQPRLFSPLGIIPGIWESDSRNINFGGWGLYLTTEDIAKFVDLLVHGGAYGGKQLIPSSYLAEATCKQADNSMNELPDWKLGYGYQFWRSQFGFRADGACGQYGIVIPEKAVGIAITACVENMQNILSALWEELIPNLSECPRQEDGEAHRDLLALMNGLSLPVATGLPHRTGIDHCWEFKLNSAGIHTISIAFGEDACALTFTTDRGSEQLRAGFGHHLTSVFQLTDHLSHPTAASAAWVDDETLEIRTFCVDGTFRDTYRINFGNVFQPITRTSYCSTFRPPMPELYSAHTLI